MRKRDPILKRSLEISSAGKHNVLYFGPVSFNSAENLDISDDCFSLNTIKIFYPFEILNYNSQNFVTNPLNKQLILLNQSECNFLFVINPCLCGNLGRDDEICICSDNEINYYWTNVRNIFFSYIDMVIPLKEESLLLLFSEERTDKRDFFETKTSSTIGLQKQRFSESANVTNSKISISDISRYCILENKAENLFSEIISKLDLPRKSLYSILKIARTIADMDNSNIIKKNHLLESIYYRKYGCQDIFWRII